MRVLLDTHVVVWAIYTPERLPQPVRQIIELDSNQLLVSHASLWELLGKVGRGKVQLTGSSIARVMERIYGLGVTLVPVTLANILSASSLPHHHSDPFDRMLIAQALAEGAALVTVDRKIQSYEVPTLWA